MKRNLYLVGFSGSGKSTVGRLAARALGWTFVDTDDEIVRAAGTEIDSIFTESGEEGFRDAEHAALSRVAGGEHQVVSTGGGIVTAERNRRLMSGSGLVVCLEARPEAIGKRVSAQDAGPVRPMIDPWHKARDVSALKAERQPMYALSDWTVHTDSLTAQAAADEVVRAFWMLSSGQDPQLGDERDSDLAAVVRTSSGDYPVWVGWDMLASIGEIAGRLAGSDVAYVIADEGSSRHARRVQASLESAGIAAHIFTFQMGEAHKSLRTVELIYRWLAGRRAERRHLIVAVGGGVVGDLAGYVAATYLRGLPFAQVPTTLLAMVDASVGGKTGVDLPQGKNLVGAFHQPRFVLSDVATLRTLPERTRTEGWAEVIKHALAFEGGLLTGLETHCAALLELEPERATEAIRQSVALKANVVSSDEHETLGRRILLNYGHTLGHALESVTGYDRFLHGEAVSVGMMAAGRIAADLGMLTGGELERQRRLLRSYGLPTAAPGVDAGAIRSAMLSDKKVSRGRVRWVLLEGIGRAVVRTDVADTHIDDAISAVAPP